MGVLGVRQKGTRGRELVANLTAQDRCDRCPAAAGAVVLLKAPAPNILLFCLHHTNKYEVALATVGAVIYRKDEDK